MRLVKGLGLWVLLAFSLTGCAVVWGKPYKVEFMSESSVNVTYDPALTNMGEVQNVAQAHCAKYGKDAYPGKDMSSPWGLTSLVFRCQPRPPIVAKPKG